MNIKQHIPNLLTLGNLFCGCVGIVWVLHGYLYAGFLLMLVALILDFLDGFVARVLGVSGELGAQLDSLADAVTFGVLPSMYMYVLLLNKTSNEYLPFFGFLIALMSAYRLAKFNIDTEQSTHFKGLPTPINAIFFASVAYIESDIYSIPLYGVIALVIVFSILLVSNIPLLALKFKSFGWKENQAKYILIIFAIGLLSWWQVLGVVLLLPVYILISFLHFKLKLV